MSETIVTVEEVKTAFKLPNHSDVEDAVESALTAGETYLSGLYQSPFTMNASRSDVFRPDSTQYPQIMNKMFRLRLRQAFVITGSVTVTYSEDALDPTWTAVPSTDYTVDLEKGIVYVRAEDASGNQSAYDGNFVRVVYDAGIDGDTSVAPAWLKQALLTYMGPILNNTNVQNHEELPQKQMTDSVRLVGDMIAPYMRGFSQHIRPVF